VELKNNKSPGSEEILTKLIQVGGETLRSEIHKFVNSLSSNQELCKQ
jgi:hypothetical protein